HGTSRHAHRLRKAHCRGNREVGQSRKVCGHEAAVTEALQTGYVESRKGAVAWAMRQRSVSLPRSSNRTGGFPASGFPIGFTMEHTDKKIGCKRVLRSIFPVLHSLIRQPPTGPVVHGVIITRLIANHRDLPILGSTPSLGLPLSQFLTLLGRVATEADQ